MKADLHVHTLYSNDGKTTLEELLEYAERMGIGCIAVTDHNQFEAYERLKDNGRVIIVPAEEVSSAEGHIVALGIDRLIPRDLSIQETIDRIHEAGGYAFAAHRRTPWRIPSTGSRPATGAPPRGATGARRSWPGGSASR